MYTEEDDEEARAAFPAVDDSTGGWMVFKLSPAISVQDKRTSLHSLLTPSFFILQERNVIFTLFPTKIQSRDLGRREGVKVRKIRFHSLAVPLKLTARFLPSAPTRPEKSSDPFQSFK